MPWIPVGDGLEALDTARVGSYDLVILDLMLPGLHGTELLKRLRQVNAEVPVLVLTARDAVADKIANFEAGADDYLTKPFAFAELGRAGQSPPAPGPVTRANVLRIADLEIDRLSHQVRRNGDSIKLTAKEYSLVEYLALNTGRVLSRSMIVEHVWDQSFEGLTNIVDVYVRQLRAKLDEPYKPRLIHTARGVRLLPQRKGAMNTRSITFRLAAWCAGISLLVCIGFGLYTYLGLRYYLHRSQTDTLQRRARQVAAIVNAHIGREGDAFTIELIKTSYAPEHNDRFIRIRRPDGSFLYVSGQPTDKSFDPASSPRCRCPRARTKAGVPSRKAISCSCKPARRPPVAATSSTAARRSCRASGCCTAFWRCSASACR